MSKSKVFNVPASLRFFTGSLVRLLAIGVTVGGYTIAYDNDETPVVTDLLKKENPLTSFAKSLKIKDADEAAIIDRYASINDKYAKTDAYFRDYGPQYGDDRKVSKLLERAVNLEVENLKVKLESAKYKALFRKEMSQSFEATGDDKVMILPRYTDINSVRFFFRDKNNEFLSRRKEVSAVVMPSVKDDQYYVWAMWGSLDKNYYTSPSQVAGCTWIDRRNDFLIIDGKENAIKEADNLQIYDTDVK